jgi:hypothetical protein
MRSSAKSVWLPLHQLQRPWVRSRVSFETSFDSKQPKLEPKLVSALSETKRLFRLFRFYTETESFDVSIEPKQTEDQPKQFEEANFAIFVLVQKRLPLKTKPFCVSFFIISYCVLRIRTEISSYATDECIRR